MRTKKAPGGPSAATQEPPAPVAEAGPSSAATQKPPAPEVEKPPAPEVAHQGKHAEVQMIAPTQALLPPPLPYTIVPRLLADRLTILRRYRLAPLLHICVTIPNPNQDTEHYGDDMAESPAKRRRRIPIVAATAAHLADDSSGDEAAVTAPLLLQLG